MRFDLDLFVLLLNVIVFCIISSNFLFFCLLDILEFLG